MKKINRVELLMQKPIWKEQQQFREVWIMVVTLMPVLLILFIVIAQVFLGKTIGNNPANNTELGIVLLVVILPALLIFFSKLETVICETGIAVGFFPFHKDFRLYSWQEIEKCYVRVYSPIGEFGGWGLRGLGKNRAFNVSGNNGLQLVLKDDSKLLIGTQKPDELTAALVKLGKFHS
jgi:hypothetical protein